VAARSAPRGQRAVATCHATGSSVRAQTAAFSFKVARFEGGRSVVEFHALGERAWIRGTVTEREVDVRLVKLETVTEMCLERLIAPVEEVAWQSACTLRFRLSGDREEVLHLADLPDDARGFAWELVRRCGGADTCGE
jgi:hypothetical protein